MQQVKADCYKRGGVTPKVLAALAALVLAFVLAPTAPAQAFADGSALSVEIAAGTNQGSGKVSFDVLTGNSCTLYAQVQNASMGDVQLVEDGKRVAEGTADGNEADFADFSVKWYKDSVDEANLLKTCPLSWNSYYNRPAWSTDLWYSPEAPQAAGTYKFYAVATWSLDGYQSATSGPLEFTLNVTDPVVSDIVGVADPQEGGSVSFEVNGEQVTQAKTGDEVSVVATPKDGYVVGEVSVKDANGQDVKYYSYYESFDMPATNVTVTATFVKVVTSDIETVASEHGTVVYKVNGEEVTQAKTNDTVRLTIEPEHGYAKESVSAVDAEGNAVAIDRYNSFVMPSSKVLVTVVYKELPKFNVVKNPNLDTATGDISFDKATFVSGDTINVTITPAAGYELSEFTLTDPDGNEIQSSKWGDYTLYSQVAADGLSATIKIHNYWDLEGGGQNSDLVVGATFQVAPDRYDIETAELGEGVKSVSYKVDGKEVVKAAKGDVVTIYPVTNYGFDFDAVSVVDENGQPIETTLGTYQENGGKYYFTMAEGKVTVTVTAVSPTFTVAIDDAIENGTISFAEGAASTFTGASVADDDLTIPFTITANPGFKLDETSFRVLDESGYELGYWDGVSWDAQAGTVSISSWILDGSCRTLTVTGSFVSMGADDVAQAITELDSENPDSAAVAAARTAFDNLSAEDQEKLGAAVEAKLLKAEVKIAASEKAALEAEKTELEGKVSDTSAELQTAQGKLNEAQESLEKAAKDLETATAEKTNAEQARDEAKSALETANGKLGEAEAQLEKANKELAEAKQAQSSSDAVLVSANARIASLEKELANAKKAAKPAGKASNPMKVKGKTVSAKKAKKTTIKAKKAFIVSNAKGKLTYAKLSGNDKITVKTNGNVVVKKNLKKKTYKVKVLVVASGNSKFAPVSKIVTLKVKVS